jgi:hypothetical protein
MIYLKGDTRAPALPIAVPAKEAGVIVAFENGQAKLSIDGLIPNAAFPAEPIPMFGTGFDAIAVFIFGLAFVPRHLLLFGLKPTGTKFRITPKLLVDVGPIIEGCVPRLVAHFAYRRVVAFR